MSQAYPEDKSEDPNIQNKKWKGRNNNWYHRDTKIIRILWAVICQQVGHPRRNGQISRNMQPVKIESGKNWQSEQTNH